MATHGRDPRIAIMGAGPGGLCMAIRLKQEGFSNFVVLEKSSQVGGTWNHNRYPGCACDIQSHLYSYSFEIKPDWSRPYAPQPEILEYMEFCASKYGILPHCQFGDAVERASWDESAARWTVHMASGRRVEADIVIPSIGMFNDVVFPDIEGLDDFQGPSFHSSRWNWAHDLSNDTVGVIGSAASAIQLVPEVARMTKHVYLFQRTANWVLPKEDDPFSEEQLARFRANPEAAIELRNEIFDSVDAGQAFKDPHIIAEMEAAGRMNLEAVTDPELRRKLTPDHPWGCKRPLFSNDYYPAFNRPDLELVTEGIARITNDGVVTVDGEERRLDTLVLATGFAATEYLSAIEVTGRRGLTLEEAWKDGAQAYMGVTTAGFPNLFMLYGPNTNMGSIITMIEWQVEHTLSHIQRIARENLSWLDVDAGIMAAYNDQLQQEISEVTSWQGTCNNYYRAPSGRVVTQWPHSMSAFKEQLDAVDPGVFEAAPR